MELRGDILGLLHRGSPVTRADGVAGVVSLVYASGAVDVATADRTVETESPSIYALDLGSRTGRFHAREWLRERGHDVGSEDRAEVLAWSVLSVWMGGNPLAGVAQKWSFVAKTSEWRRKAARPGFWTASVRRTGWQSMGGMGDKTGEAGKAAADADLLALGWALTNADGSLTLPPLPGAK